MVGSLGHVRREETVSPLRADKPATHNTPLTRSLSTHPPHRGSENETKTHKRVLHLYYITFEKHSFSSALFLKKGELTEKKKTLPRNG